jgi:hypothetical protein
MDYSPGKPAAVYGVGETNRTYVPARGGSLPRRRKGGPHPSLGDPGRILGA